MKYPFHPLRLIVALGAAYALYNPVALAADISATVPSGGGFVIKNSTGTQERFRVQDSGEVLAPGLSDAPANINLTCFDVPTGRLGPCAAGIGAGATGATGPVGPTGATGSTGPAGATGAAGPVGVTGTTGMAGPTGVTGAVGPTGAAGAIGATGPAGAIGATGAAGAIGATGPAGAIGATGPAGVIGATGATGATGADSTVPGPQGLQGPQGLPGIQGPTGAAGANSAVPGPVGPTGTQGLQGPTGPTGLAGATGAMGPAGPTGPAGTTALFGTNTSRALSGQPGADCTLGQVLLAAGNKAGGTPAAGQVLTIASNAPLYSLLGTMYGGNGTTTFALPDLRNAAPNGLTYVICTSGIFPEAD